CPRRWPGCSHRCCSRVLPLADPAARPARATSGAGRRPNGMPRGRLALDCVHARSGACPMPWLFLLLAVAALAIAFMTSSVALVVICLVAALVLLCLWILGLL